MRGGIRRRNGLDETNVRWVEKSHSGEQGEQGEQGEYGVGHSQDT